MKKLISIAALAAALLMLFACAGKDDGKTLDVDVTADALFNGLVFDDTLEKSEPDIACSLYGIDETDCSGAAFYAGSGATADEIAVFNAKDSESLSRIKAAAEARIVYLREGYSDYGPSEVPKIDSAVIKTSGNTLILVICVDPENVGQIVK